MARLFITPKEIDFISDITKEVIKDVIGQRIYYFPINELKTDIHPVYREAPEKIFDNPIALEALVEFKTEGVRTNVFGTEEIFDIDAWVHARDLLDKGVQLAEGDFFSYGDVFFEIVKLTISKTIYGQVEHQEGYHLFGKEARRSQFISKLFGPTEEGYSDPDAVQDVFVQQRGFATNKQGETNDVRDLHKKGITEKGITGPREVSPKGSTEHAGSSFYGDED